MPLTDEQSKAVAEIAKTAGTAVKAAKEFFDRVLGGSLSEAGGMLADEMKLIRYRNTLRIRDKVAAIHAQRKLAGKTSPVPPKYAVPMLEQSSWEEDETLQDMWAGLIANAMDPQKRLDLKRVFSDVLGSLEPLDVKILHHLSAQGWAMFRNVGGGIPVPALTNATGASEKDVQLSLQNLHRLGLVVDEFLTSQVAIQSLAKNEQIGSSSFGIRVVAAGTTFRPSQLGHALLAACAA